MSVLDFRVLKAIGSPTRLSIIRRLRSGHMTLSDLSAHFGMHPSSVKEHLDLLSEAGLVKLEDEGRKWKYYSLTPSGAGIISGGELKIALPALFGFAFLWMSARGFGRYSTEAASAMQESAVSSAKAGGASAVAGSAVSGVPQQAPDFFSILLAAIGLALVFFSIALWIGRRKKRVPV